MVSQQIGIFADAAMLKKKKKKKLLPDNTQELVSCFSCSSGIVQIIQRCKLQDWKTFNQTTVANIWPAWVHKRPPEASLCMKEEGLLAWSIFTGSIKTDPHPESCARCCPVVQRLDKGRKTRFGGVVNRNARLSCFSSSNIVSSRGSEVATCQPCRMPLGGRSHQRRRWPLCGSHLCSARGLCRYETVAFPRSVS